jgi:hypothetical protein
VRTSMLKSRLVRGLGAVSLVAALSVVATGPPALADVVCTGDQCVVTGTVVDTPAGQVTVTVTAANVVTVALVPVSRTFMFGVPFAVPPGPPCLPAAAVCITDTRTSLTTAGGDIAIDSVMIPPGLPGRIALPNLVVVSIHPPSPCRSKTVGTTVTFTPISSPVGGP